MRADCAIEPKGPRMSGAGTLLPANRTGQNDRGQKEAKKAVQQEPSKLSHILHSRADDIGKHTKDTRTMKNLKNEALTTMATTVRFIQRWTMLFALVLTAGVLTSQPVAASAATVYATINGGGGAVMEGPILLGNTVWGAGITLYSDGTASGVIHCIDVHGATAPGNVWGPVTSWSRDGDGNIVLHVSNGQIVFFPGGFHQPSGPFDVTIQSFGGAGVGHWTLAVPDG